MSEDRIRELRARNHDLANQVMQERAKRIAVEAVAQAAAAFVEAKPEYDDIASLLVALKEAVKEWRR